VQTLVENAVKHGAASVRGRADVRIHAQARDGRLALTVTDNGPGFRDQPVMPRTRGGYGLVNIRQRLDGYFHGTAALTVDRDAARGMTIVSVDLPLLREEPAQLPAAGPKARPATEPEAGLKARPASTRSGQ
jgi:two-component system sensor histidine kinase YesM